LSSKDNYQEGLFEFIEYALQGFVDNLESQIQLIEAQQLHVHWVNFVHDQFKASNTSATRDRRRRLLLDLSEQVDAEGKVKSIPLNELRYISSRLAEAYAGKTEKTVQRDVNT